MPIYMDFAAILTIATGIAGIIWLIDVLCFKKKRLAADPSAVEPKIVEYAHAFFPILLIVLLLRSFVAEPFRIPSGSMKPTLLEGDFILVNKFTYGLRLPVIGLKVVKIGEPKRGDILVFRYPKNTSVDYIKRVIGLPGDVLSYKDKKIFVNGKPLEQEFKGKDVDMDIWGQLHDVQRFQENLEENPHAIYIYPSMPGRDMPDITIPEGHYFVMGDNRDGSEDSRVWGFVPENLILGKAFFIWMSWNGNAKDIRWKRIGHQIGTV